MVERKVPNLLVCLHALWAGSFCHLSLAAPIGFRTGEENVTLFNNRNSLDVAAPPPLVESLDFNGDGHNDLAVLTCSASTGQVRRVDLDVFMGPLQKEDSFLAGSDMRAYFSRGTNFTLPYPTLSLADVNKDGKGDLIIGRPDVSSNRGNVEILFGRASPSGSINLDSTAPDLQLLGKPNALLGLDMAAEDFNGDGAGDVAIGSPGTNECYLLLGGPGLSPGIFDLSQGNPLHRILKSGLGSQVLKADFNRDGKDDLALSNSEANTGGGTRSGEINIVFGTTTFPSVWTLDSSPENVRVWGRNSEHILAVGTGDLTGDRRDELVVGSYSGQLTVLDGSDVDSVRSVLTPSTGSANTAIFCRVKMGRFSLG